MMNYMHIINEAFLYLFCLFMVYFSILETSFESRITIGYVFIACFISWTCLNFTVIIYLAIKFAKLLLQRSYFRFNHRLVAKDVSKVANKLRRDFKNEQGYENHVLKETKTAQGGFKYRILVHEPAALEKKIV